MARRVEATVRRLEREYAAELAEVALENLLEFVDLRWYRHAAYNRGDGWDFVAMSGARKSGLPGLHKVAQYLDRCAARDEFPHPLPIVKAVLPWRHDLIRAATPPPDDDLEPDRPEINLMDPSTATPNALSPLPFRAKRSAAEESSAPANQTTLRPRRPPTPNPATRPPPRPLPTTL